VYAIRHRLGKPPGVRGPVEAGADRSKSFLTRGLADSYSAELVGAAREGLEIEPATGEPAQWAEPARPSVTAPSQSVTLCRPGRPVSCGHHARRQARR
jgi:hypothetical protein